MQNTSLDKPHYTYTLAYPDAMGGRVFYVGKGKGNRIHQHEREAKSGKDYKSHKCCIIRKIWENGEQFVKTKLASFETHEEACMHEIALIFFMDGLVNLTAGGDGVVGYTYTEEHRHKISETSKGRTYSEETRRKMSEVAKGRIRSEETRRKMSDAKKGHVAWNKGKKGVPLSEETRRKISEANRRRTLSEETRRKISEAKKQGHALRREQALQAVRTPNATAGSETWKNGLVMQPLWDTSYTATR